MEFNLIAAVAGGFIGTAVMTAMMMMSPQMGMPKMDMPGLLGSMFGTPGNKMLGLMMHFMMGVVFAIIYAVLFATFTDANVTLLSVAFAVVHWFIVGLMMGMMPVMHSGIKSGDVSAPGLYMTNIGGMLGFMGGMMGHIVFGLVVGIVYTLIAG